MSTRERLSSMALAVVVLGVGVLGRTPAAAASSSHAGETPSCLWRYVVTDGVYNDVLIYDDVSSTTIVGRIHPGEEFRTPRPPRLVAGSQGVRLEIRGGWVGYGNYTVPQSSSGPCARITLDTEKP